MSQTLVTIIAGRDFSAEAEPLEPNWVENRLDTIRKELAARFGGFSETHGIGGWINQEGRLIQERNIRWDIIVSRKLHAQEAYNVARMVAQVLNQYSVLLETRKSRYEFVEQQVTA